MSPSDLQALADLPAHIFYAIGGVFLLVGVLSLVTRLVQR